MVKLFMRPSFTCRRLGITSLWTVTTKKYENQKHSFNPESMVLVEVPDRWQVHTTWRHYKLNSERCEADIAGLFINTVTNGIYLRSVLLPATTVSSSRLASDLARQAPIAKDAVASLRSELARNGTEVPALPAALFLPSSSFQALDSHQRTSISHRAPRQGPADRPRGNFVLEAQHMVWRETKEQPSITHQARDARRLSKNTVDELRKEGRVYCVMLVEVPVEMKIDLLCVAGI
ncbi:hypothetical protein CPC08DRAFT_723466 [Agrocybe pediades]|nr:hypothetical protein CPC08DRAFT_723466 [Agrocybe pediades]